MWAPAYIKFQCKKDTEWAVAELNNCWFGRRAMYAELSPVTNYLESCCWYGKMYSRWLVQLHAPATHLLELPEAALWFGAPGIGTSKPAFKTSHILRPLYAKTNLILCSNNNVSRLLNSKTSPEPHPKTSI